MHWSQSDTSPAVLAQLRAETDRHRPIPLTNVPGAVVGGLVDIGDDRIGPFIATIVRVDATTAWIHVDGPIHPRLQWKLKGMAPQ